MLGWMKTWWNPAPFSRDASNSAEKGTMVGGNPKRCAVSMAWDSPTWKQNSKFPFRCSREFRLLFFWLFGSPPHWLSIGRWVGPSCTSQQNSQVITYQSSRVSRTKASTPWQPSWCVHPVQRKGLGSVSVFGASPMMTNQGPKATHILNHQDPSHSQAARSFFSTSKRGCKTTPLSKRRPSSRH